MGKSELTNFQLTHGHAASVDRCDGGNASDARQQARKQVGVRKVRMQKLDAMHANDRHGKLKCFPLHVLGNRGDVYVDSRLSQIISEPTFERTQTKNLEAISRQAACEAQDVRFHTSDNGIAKYLQER